MGDIDENIEPQASWPPPPEINQPLRIAAKAGSLWQKPGVVPLWLAVVSVVGFWTVMIAQSDSTHNRNLTTTDVVVALATCGIAIVTHLLVLILGLLPSQASVRSAWAIVLVAGDAIFVYWASANLYMISSAYFHPIYLM